MIKQILKRAASLALTAALVMGMLPLVETPANAANVNTGVTGLSAESSGSGDATWTPSSGTITGSVKASSSSGCTGTTYTAQSGTLTFTNNSGARALLSFDYSLELNSGSATVDGSAVTAGAAFSKTLEAGSSVAVAITSPESDSTTKITIRNLKLTAEQEVNITLKKATNGSYTVDGAAVTADITKTVLTTTAVALSATPSNGYKFLGWYNETKQTYPSTAASWTTSFTESTTIEPKFVKSSTALFQVGSKIFEDLNAAVSYAQSSGESKITLISDGTLSAGNYTIPSGKTLLIPFDDAQTVYTSAPDVTYNSYTTPTAFKTLTMASGATITVQNGGAICCSGKLSSKGQMGGNNGTPTGPDGRINMKSGSTITVNNGGNLYCWGYIYGSGSVIAESGATVYEAFQIKDWRGGSATSNCYDYAFIFSQYYIQNIEVPVTLYAGASEKLYSSVNASSSAHPMGATLIGSGGLFNNSDGYIIKDYIESTDRLNIETHGNVSITPMSLTGLPLIGSISLDQYEMPITNNLTIDLKSDTATVSQDIKLLPGAEIIVGSDANFSVASGKKVFLYDNDDWKNYTGTARLYVIGYSVANGTAVKRNANSLVDAKVDVKDELSVSGKLYTSTAGSNITSSSGTGKVVLSTAADTSDATIYEMEGNKTKTAVTFNPARLHNADNTYTPTAEATETTTFSYCTADDSALHTGGHWYTDTVSFEANEGTGNMSDLHYAYTEAFTLPANSFTRNGYVFSGWNTEANGSGTAYSDKQANVQLAKGGSTLYAQWNEAPNLTILDSYGNEHGTYGSLFTAATAAGSLGGNDLYVRVNQDYTDTSALSGYNTVTLDLNGHAVTYNSGSFNATQLFLIDSATDGYEDSSGQFISNVVPAKKIASIVDYNVYDSETGSVDHYNRYFVTRNGSTYTADRVNVSVTGWQVVYDSKDTTTGGDGSPKIYLDFEGTLHATPAMAENLQRLGFRFTTDGIFDDSFAGQVKWAAPDDIDNNYSGGEDAFRYYYAIELAGDDLANLENVYYFSQAMADFNSAILYSEIADKSINVITALQEWPDGKADPSQTKPNKEEFPEAYQSLQRFLQEKYNITI